MATPRIGRSIRRLREQRSLTQSALAERLGISASYLNLIEHEQRKVTASLLIKCAELFGVDVAALAGSEERRAETALREVFGDPALGAQVPDAERDALAALPHASASVLALHRALRVARQDAAGLALPSGRRIQLPYEEAHDAFQDHSNHFPNLEERADAIRATLPGGGALPAEMNHAVAERLRLTHGLAVRVLPLEGAIRHYDPAARTLSLSEQLPRESRGFQMAFQLVLLEARDEIDVIIGAIGPSSKEASSVIRIGLLNYAAAALLMPYAAFAEAARALRHDFEALAARFSVSYEQACQRLTTLQSPRARGIPFFFLRTDLAGNISKRFSAGRFPFARYGGTCPRWIVHHAALTPGAIRVQLAQLEDGATFLTVARCLAAPAAGWSEPPPVHVIGMGCDVTHARDLVYADGIDLARAAVGIGLSCRLCNRDDCRSRAFPPLEHRLELDLAVTGASPWMFRKA